MLAFVCVATSLALFAVTYAAPQQTDSSVEAAVSVPDTAQIPAAAAAPTPTPSVQAQRTATVKTAAPIVHQTAPAQTVSTPVAPGVPTSIVIPKISLNATVIPVGLTPDNAVDVPNTLKLSGWYTKSPIPGNKGSALIDGHVGNSIGFPGVFANLHKLAIGDSIYVKGKNGSTEHFIVRDMKVYALADVPMAYILENTNERRLNIITCSGAWVPSASTFDHRLVVYAELAN
jgi:LPXTG-site transpeptidase (sortase) family protein